MWRHHGYWNFSELAEELKEKVEEEFSERSYVDKEDIFKLKIIINKGLYYGFMMQYCNFDS